MVNNLFISLRLKQMIETFIQNNNEAQTKDLQMFRGQFIF